MCECNHCNCKKPEPNKRYIISDFDGFIKLTPEGVIKIKCDYLYIEEGIWKCDYWKNPTGKCKDRNCDYKRG